jgi:hypothetical protein
LSFCLHTLYSWWSLDGHGQCDAAGHRLVCGVLPPRRSVGRWLCRSPWGRLARRWRGGWAGTGRRSLLCSYVWTIVTQSADSLCWSIIITFFHIQASYFS